MILLLIYGCVNGTAVTAVTNYAKRPLAWRAALFGHAPRITLLDPRGIEKAEPAAISLKDS